MSQAITEGNFGGSPPITGAQLLVAVGSNRASTSGGPVEIIQAGFEAIENRGAAIRACSRFYRTPAFPAGNGPDFVNAAIVLDAPWSPQQAVEVLHEVESLMGRTRRERWGERTLDLDLLGVGQTVLPDAQTHAYWRNLPLEAQMQQTPTQLIVPHPRLHERAFVLVPLADVAPDWVHPVLGRSVREMCDDLPSQARAEVVAL
ncbi:2-amino-4-hydroxy-6-hydroxymethyldihydropteridine diphosphokinase [Sulfitobacter sp. S190]|uniref:2-amino-4-hydroxy-6- hydroxymethyldihydropteridine diphosphokinase n=1 Tax=Sulfitobacter sp. S190 TaxID=2867022 RepID=UPI0021A5E97B|nr:2-amino-4-hydroxy-6-hydroxymethyldihydropteridine diphosphokinase [Sulfitobacter sp. S190]UWR22898.1 2-amino-4-hydroxy-6-hydroxymethyldihydropteridine diphosphokinase [Sulfitobacter sp. S190]